MSVSGRPYKQADRVAADLSRKLEDFPWMRGVSVEGSDDEYGVVVRVATDPEALPDLPESIDGVPIRIVRRALARAH